MTSTTPSGTRLAGRARLINVRHGLVLALLTLLYGFGLGILFGLGALGYSLFWLLAAYRAPSLGSTGLAKQSLRWLAMPSSIFCVVGMCLALGLVLRALYRKVPY